MKKQGGGRCSTISIQIIDQGNHNNQQDRNEDQGASNQFGLGESLTPRAVCDGVDEIQEGNNEVVEETLHD